MRALLRLPVVCLAAALATTALPVLAQSQPSPVQLVAQITGGLVDGGKVLMGSLGIGSVRQTAANTFEIQFGGGEPAFFVFGNPSHCIFTQDVSMEGWPTTSARFNLNVVDRIMFTDQGTLEGYDGVHFFLMQLEGLPSMAQMANAEGEMIDLPVAAASIATSMTMDQLLDAAYGLAALCPMSEMR